jgi:hypothetical protein
MLQRMGMHGELGELHGQYSRLLSSVCELCRMICSTKLS